MLATAVWLLSSSAQADGAFPSIYAGLVGGVGISTGDSEITPYGVALGGRAGLTIPTTDIYVGAFGLYHLGEEINLVIGDISHSLLMVGGEGGYEFSFGPFVLRPSLGVGMSSLFVTGASAAAQEIRVEAEGAEALYLSPGVNAMIALGILLGAEVRYNFVFTDRIPDGVSILGTLGFGI